MAGLITFKILKKKKTKLKPSMPSAPVTVSEAMRAFHYPLT